MSPAFTALVKKERHFLIAAFLGSTIAGVLTLLAEGFEYQFVLGSFEKYTSFALVQGGLALLCGIWLGLREEATHTQEFLCHRQIAPELCLLARGLAGASVAFLTPILAGALFVSYEVSFGGGGAGIRPESWSILAAVGASALATFAAGFAAAALPGSSLARGGLLVLLLAAQITLQSWLGSQCSGLAWTLALLGWGAVLLMLARASGERGLDLDRAVSVRLLGLPLAVAAVSAAVFGSLATAGWHKLISDELAEERPWIGWTTDGRLVRCRYDLSGGSLAVLDEQGRPTGERLDDDQPRVAAPRYKRHGFGVFRWPQKVWWDSLPATEEAHLRYLAFDDSGVRAIELRRNGERVEHKLVSCEELGGPGGEVRVFEGDSKSEDRFAFTPGGRLWRLTEGGLLRAEEVVLPDGARPTGTSTYWPPEGSWRNVLETSAGPRLLEGGAWLSPDPSLTQHPKLTSETLDPDPLTPLQRITAPNGATLELDHALDSTRKKLLGALMGASTVLRPLPLALVSVTLDYEAVAQAEPDEFLVLFDPLLGGGYAWLLLPNILLHVWLAWATSRELARRGMDPARRRRWTLAYLVAGIWIGAWCAALETRRAWKKSRSGPAPAPLVHAPRGATT
ncbi:MAG: hypothetical protein ABL998_07800 [Planctomycetota bacterium]